MKNNNTLLPTIRMTAANVAETAARSLGDWEVDTQPYLVTPLGGPFAALYSFDAVTPGGSHKKISVSTQLSDDRKSILVMAPGASVGRLSLAEWQTRWAELPPKSQAQVVSEALYANAKRDGKLFPELHKPAAASAASERVQRPAQAPEPAAGLSDTIPDRLLNLAREQGAVYPALAESSCGGIAIVDLDSDELWAVKLVKK